MLVLAFFAVPFSIAQGQAAAAAQSSATMAGGHASAEKGTVSAEQVWADLMEGNQRFVAGKPQAREFTELRHALAGGQHPKVVVLACSDSRVAPELLFDKNLGDLFVIRAAGNIADPIGLGSIEYAVEHLGSSVLVVLGHEKCGAVTAACSEEKMPSPNLQAMVDKIEPAVRQAKSHAKPADLVPAAILDNVHQSASDVLANSEILRHAVKDEHLTIIEAVYKLDSGEVVRLGKPPALQ
jgi:carbonic anhydrase